MLHVMRRKAGDEVLVFDGRGFEYPARIVEVARRSAVLEIGRGREVDREPARSLTIATAVPRGHRMDFLVEKCCELGLRGLVPMHCRRSVIDPRERRANRVRKWRRIAVEASKQSGRARLTDIHEPAALGQVIQRADAFDAHVLLSTAVRAQPLTRLIRRWEPGLSALALVGPEGGLTPAEVQAAKEAGFEPASLGRSTLRVETAAIAVAAAVLLDSPRPCCSQAPPAVPAP